MIESIDFGFLIHDLVHEITDKLEEIPHVAASDCGLSERAGKFWVDVDGGVIISQYSDTLDYYGGFDLVDKGCRDKIGKYVIYSKADERVEEAINIYRESLK